MSGTEPTAACVLGHEPEAVIFDGEFWKIICPCSWECWDQEDEEGAWEAYNDHVFDAVNTILREQREATKVVTL